MCMRVYVYTHMCMRVYMRIYMRVCVKISTIYHHQTKKRVDPPAGPQSKSLFDPSNQNKKATFKKCSFFVVKLTKIKKSKKK